MSLPHYKKNSTITEKSFLQRVGFRRKMKQLKREKKIQEADLKLKKTFEAIVVADLDITKKLMNGSNREISVSWEKACEA